MFVQIIEAHVSDPDHLDQQLQRWRDEVKPGAVGFLGSTAGVADDGTGFVLACFESADAAEANSQRPEQGAWFSDAEKGFDGDVEFTESTDVRVAPADLPVPPESAGFVQVMRGSVADRDQLAQIDRALLEHRDDWRPDLLGSIRAWTSGSDYIEVAYFTTEEEARRNEAADPPPEAAEAMATLQSLVPSMTFLDLHHPILVSR
jgi:hypothetical protein